MRYLLKQISWQRHDRASALYVRNLIRSESHSIWLCWRMVHGAFLASPSITVTCIEHSRAYNLQLDYAHRPSCWPSFRASSLKPPPSFNISECGVVHVVMTCAYAFACRIVIDAGTELLDRALTFAAEWTVW